MPSHHDSSLDRLVEQMAVDDVIALSDDGVEQEESREAEVPLDEDGDSEGFDYGDEEDYEEDYESDISPPTPVDVEMQVEEDTALASFRRGWQAELGVAHQAPLAPPNLLRVLEEPTILHRILSSPVLSHSDLRSAALVTSAFLQPVRAILFHSITLATPYQAIRLSEALKITPSLAQHVQKLVLSLGDVNAILREAPFVQSRMAELRKEQDEQPNEWYWPDGSVRRGAAIEGKQAWEEQLLRKLGRGASAEELERARRDQLYEEATAQDLLSSKAKETLVAHLRSTFRSWPFEAVAPVDGDSYSPLPVALASTTTTPSPTPIETILIPPLKPSFTQQLLEPLANVPEIVLAIPANCLAPSRLLSAFGQASTTKSLIINPAAATDAQVTPDLGVRLSAPRCSVVLRKDGLGPLEVSSSIEVFELREASLEWKTLGPCKTVRWEGPSWSLRSLELERVSWVYPEVSSTPDREGVEEEQSRGAEVGMVDFETDSRRPPANLYRFVGLEPHTLTSLILSHVDGVSWSSIHATILHNSSTLVTVHLSNINIGTSQRSTGPPPTSDQALVSTVPSTDDSEGLERVISLRQRTVNRYYVPLSPAFDEEGEAADVELQGAVRREEEGRFLPYKLWGRWMSPSALPPRQVASEQRLKTLAERLALPPNDPPSSIDSRAFDLSTLDPDSPDDGSFAYALSRCSALKSLHLADTTEVEETVFHPHLVEALIHANAPISDLEWRVGMVHWTKGEWEAWEAKVQRVMQAVDARGEVEEEEWMQEGVVVQRAPPPSGMKVYVQFALQREEGKCAERRPGSRRP